MYNITIYWMRNRKLNIVGILRRAIYSWLGKIYFCSIFSHVNEGLTCLRDSVQFEKYHGTSFSVYGITENNNFSKTSEKNLICFLIYLRYKTRFELNYKRTLDGSYIFIWELVLYHGKPQEQWNCLSWKLPFLLLIEIFFN